MNSHEKKLRAVIWAYGACLAFFAFLELFHAQLPSSLDSLWKNYYDQVNDLVKFVVTAIFFALTWFYREIAIPGFRRFRIKLVHHYLRDSKVLWDMLETVPSKHRIGLAFGLTEVGKAWSGLFSKTAEEQAGQSDLVAAFMKRYLEEEKKDVGGEAEGAAGLNFVVTNFVAYADLVSTVVASASEIYKGKKIVCHTTLPMPLPQWFNYCDGHRNAKDQRLDYFGYISRQDWLKYIQGIRELARMHTNLELTRYSLMVAGTAQNVNEAGVAFRDEEVMRTYANHQILCDKAQREPVINGDGKSVLPKDFLEEFRTRVGELLGLSITLPESAPGHVIYPDSNCNLAAPDGYFWRPLWSVFEDFYHREYRSCKACVLSEHAIKYFFSKEPLPEDIFLIGTRDSKLAQMPITWQFCLVGDIGLDVKRVSLGLLTPQLNPNLWNHVTSFANEILLDVKHSPPLSEWIAGKR